MKIEVNGKVSQKVEIDILDALKKLNEKLGYGDSYANYKYVKDGKLYSETDISPHGSSFNVTDLISDKEEDIKLFLALQDILEYLPIKLKGENKCQK